ncbi:hypothetical protein CBR_g46857 [Chara braunii]|uniref:C2 domain-containing protein n=1 Tax=Chara braunii TaxID=69332 RepID=A0A388M171_CHABU|nr:hypothetical protein CBR_g46857 [Chara braunii]|eukprot:GBG88291.1 hypothetical protein CBR_g46857 [Chara braunii]
MGEWLDPCHLSDAAAHVLLPTWREIKFSLASATLVVALYCLLTKAWEGTAMAFGDRRGRRGVGVDKSGLLVGGDGAKRGSIRAERRGSSVDLDEMGCQYSICLDLLAARNLVGANLNGTSDPYAVLTCGSQKRFSSVAPGTRNPLWGEQFHFVADELPVNVEIAIYDWDIIWKSTSLGRVVLSISSTGSEEPHWRSLDRASGQVYVQIATKAIAPDSSEGALIAADNARASRRRSGGLGGGDGGGGGGGGFGERGATEVRQKPGPLQTIFNLPPDEIVLHSFSCALERSFLYHGRMYVSTHSICFHSNVFAKHLKIVLPYEDVHEVRRSQHALINPAITIVLKAGCGGHGVPPLGYKDGKVMYKFASFWNRNHTYRVLTRSHKNFLAAEEAHALDERQQSILREAAHGFPLLSSRHLAGGSYLSAEAVIEAAKTPPRPRAPAPVATRPFLNESVLIDLFERSMTCTAQTFFTVLLSNDSDFTGRYRATRKDTELKMEPWHTTEEYGGLLRRTTFRTICTSPMCPPDSAITDWQHVTLSTDEKTLTLESIQQAHDVPFGSYFEVQGRWVVQTVGEAECKVFVKTGVNFKKWCVMQSKIKASAIAEFKADAQTWINLATEEIQAAARRGETGTGGGRSIGAGSSSSSTVTSSASFSFSSGYASSAPTASVGA